MSTVAHLRPPSAGGLLTKKQLAAELGRSERWIELKQRDGLPIAKTDRFGRRQYSLADVQRWLHAAPAQPRSTVERVAELERQVQELRAMIEEGRDR